MNQMQLEFHKYEGAGNDFILIDGRRGPATLPGMVVRTLCDRHRGIGADGLMILTEEDGYDFRMTYYNSDGGEVNMCGNGARCIVLFADHLGIGNGRKIFVGRDGVHSATIVSRGEQDAVVELGMVQVEGYEYSDDAFILDTGVPHYVEFVEDVEGIDVDFLGHQIRMGERFRTEGINVNFVQVTGPGEISVRTYERGVEGETLACGTGATAAAIATRLFSQSDRNDFHIRVRGGELRVEFHTEDNLHFTDIRLTGPARMVFQGVRNTENIPAEF